jgi:hypothetical protein
VNSENFIFKISNTVTDQNNIPAGTSVERIGLNNLRRQLYLIYGENYRLDVTREDGYFAVQLAIQLNNEAAKHEKDQVLIG